MDFLDRFLGWALPECRKIRKTAAVSREDYRKTIEELKVLTAGLDDAKPQSEGPGYWHASSR